MKGYFCMGQNPAGGGINAGLHRAGLRNLDWLVVADWFETETATFWKNDPTGPPPADIRTEVFFIPAAGSPEKDGTLTNTQRLLQWHHKAMDPPGDCRSDAWFVYNLGKRLKELYAGSTRPEDQPLLHLTWDYDFTANPRSSPTGRRAGSSASPTSSGSSARSTGTRSTRSTRPPASPARSAGFSEFKDDGSTACGCWIYSGVFPEHGRNRAAERKRSDNPIQPGLGFRLAAQPPGHVQPGLGRPRGAALVGAEEADLVGRGEGDAGSAPTSPTSSPTSPRATGRRRTRWAWMRSTATSRSS